MTADTNLDPPWQTRYMGSLGSVHDDSDFFLNIYIFLFNVIHTVLQ